MQLFPFLALLANVDYALTATPNEWRSRSIYQVVTDRFGRSDGSTTASCDPGLGKYCGGSWNGLVDKLDYIKGMGFSAVWISPVTYQEQEVTTDLASYHGYWQQDLYRLNNAFGSEDDLEALAQALHDRDMYLMLDVVVNHFAWPGNGTTVDYSNFNPFNKEEYFHPFQLLSDLDANNKTDAEIGWLGDDVLSLPDVKTEDPQVASMYYSWIESLVSNYSADGVRIDTVLNVNTDFFPGFNKAAGVFCTGEVFNGDPASSCPIQEDLDSILNFPIYFYLTRAFNSTSGNITALVDQMQDVKNNCRDIHTLATFSENHDLPRFASYTKDMSLASNIITYNILADGIPIIYYGQEQHLDGSFNPVNREALWLTKYDTNATLYKLISSLNQIRTHAYENDSYGTYVGFTIYHDDHTMAMRKGFDGSQVITVLTNEGEGADSHTLNLKNTGFSAGEKVMEVLICKEQTVQSDGTINVAMKDGQPNVFYPSKALSGSKICQPGSSHPKSGSGSGSSRKVFGDSPILAFVGVLSLWITLLCW